MILQFTKWACNRLCSDQNSTFQIGFTKQSSLILKFIRQKKEQQHNSTNSFRLQLLGLNNVILSDYSLFLLLIVDSRNTKCEKQKLLFNKQIFCHKCGYCLLLYGLRKKEINAHTKPNGLKIAASTVSINYGTLQDLLKNAARIQRSNQTRALKAHTNTEHFFQFSNLYVLRERPLLFSQQFKQ